MTQIIEPLKDEEGRKLVDFITPEVKKVLIFFWHGLGDAIMFQEPLSVLREQFPEVLFDVTAEEGLGQEDVFPGAVLLKWQDAGEFNNERVPEQFQKYDLIAKINMPMSEAQDDYTKAEWCCLTELGIEPVCGHPRLACISRLVGVHFNLTALPESGGIPYDVAKQVWDEIIEAGYTPIELLMEHKWHNPANEKYDFVDRHIRDYPAKILMLAALLQSCEAYIGSLGGDFHLALSVLPPERIIGLERDFTVPMYTKLPVKRINVKEYENGTVKEWLQQLSSLLGIEREPIPESERVKKDVARDVDNSIVRRPNKYAYIVTADIRYLPEVIGNLNSLHLIGNQQDVHYFGSKIPDEVVEQFDKLCYPLIYHAVPDEEIKATHGNSEIMRRKRYWYAAEYGQDYEAVCVLDADLIWSHLPDAFFEIAAKAKLIVGAAKEQNKIYNEPNHEYDVDGVRGWNWELPHGYYNDADLCNCPTFIDARLYEEALRKQWDIFLEGYPFNDEIPDTHFRAPDMDAMNLCFLEAVWPHTERILPLPGLMFLGTNEQFLKPYVNATMRENGLWTKNGIKIYSVHGHFYHKQWCEIQLSNRKGCIAGQLDGSPSAYRQAEGSLADLCRYAQRCLWYGPIQIERKNYRHPDKPVEDTYIWEA